MTEYDDQENIFGYRIPSPFCVLHRSEFIPAKKLVQKVLDGLLDEVGLMNYFSFSELEKKILEIYSSDHQFDKSIETIVIKELERKYKNAEVVKKIRQVIWDRSKSAAQNVHKIIKRVLPEKEKIELLDLGCGQGVLSLYLLEQPEFDEIQLKDIADFRYREVRSEKRLHFAKVNELRLAKRNHQKYDCILLHTVLHHVRRPDEIINFCIDSLKPGGVILVVETCVDVEKDGLCAKQHKESDSNRHTKGFLSLDTKNQIAFSVFLDWFFCKIMSDNILAYYQFNSPEGWKTFFKRFDGLNILSENCSCKGFDVSHSPSFQTVYVLSIRNNRP
ncbi:MAG: class I SAM-dependent methyltransferase [Bacteroidetes bacterium]|nr:MAG: class I SAM-dependent methyltransferase [Bacteroidota bacterium]